ncbi:MAG: hypothetical protein C0481_00010 [Phenylobacterium sp.]|uniref:NACHT domain-containing protein n=1 Tax=Phenylobacterium sp. TaxID=1871053 RepID=UPI0025FCD4B1|nr:hypothetical protein [Phenylobacterium sp.]MBA4010222.1 hypothetical protein [Phenylobacterium sp.]
MTYDLSRFSTQSFERFAQSLAVAQLGPSTQIFGAGADGAREATFEGDFTPFGSDQARNGYVVAQAKFLTKSKGAAQDLAWLKRQADIELRKFKSPRRGLRTPGFYILVTNVTLTPGAKNAKGKGGGTLDQMIAHMESWKRDLGVEDVWIWHADVLTALLDLHPGVRTTFGAWTLAGDVLSAMLDSFKAPEFASVIHRVVRNELKDQRGVKNQDSGRTTGQQIYVDDVFVDLPLNPHTLFERVDWADANEDAATLDEEDEDDEEGSEEPDEHEDGEDETPEWDDLVDNWNIVRAVMEKLSDKLSHLDKSHATPRATAYQRLVVLGGPGQGKSTIGQYLAQLLRARLLQAGPGTAAEIEAVAESTIRRAAEEGVPLTGPLRFPIHVPLPRYADTISKAGEEAPSLLRFVADGFARISEEEIETKRLREWLGYYPSAIILDGLDEVPRTGNRGEVIRQIERLVGDIHESGADTLVIVTSRPQGYLNDLDRKHWMHWSLADLDPHHAVRFAERLGDVLITDPHRRAEVIAILAEAAEDPSTAPLMISPLQVSLLFSLVQTSNNIPKDRWTLFERHYETLRDREIAKGGGNGDLIRKYKSQIDRIHYDAGFILQVRAEKQGNASAHFTLGEFRDLISRNVKLAILDEAECERVTARIMDVATNRLVFLGDRNEGRIAFDVRSLQEFMAAARIMVSPEPLIKARLTAIAYRSHWAHVFRIACSKVYAEASLEEFREEILTILGRLDCGDVGIDYKSIRAGARTAIALLTDSTAGARETDRAKLMNRALRVLELELKGADVLIGLAAVCDTVTRQALNLVVEENLRNTGGPLFVNTLGLLQILTHDEHPLAQWAQERLNQVVEIQRRDAVTLTALPLPQTLTAGSADYLRNLVWEAGPLSVRRWSARGEAVLAPFNSVLEHLFVEGAPIRVHQAGTPFLAAQLIYKPITALAGLGLDIPERVGPKSGWRLVAAAARFSASPNLTTLAEAVQLSDADDVEGLLLELPWPVATFVRIGRRDGSEVTATRLLAGEYGDVETMLAAENFWKARGLDMLNAPLAVSGAYDPKCVADRGPPVRRVRPIARSETELDELLTTSATWPTAARLDLLSLLPLFVSQPADAVKVAQWMRDDLIESNWDLAMRRRLAGLVHFALADTENIPLVEPVRAKLASSKALTALLTRRFIPEGVVALLQSPQTAEWAALTIYGSLPLSARKSLSALQDIDPRYLMTPRDASPELARALAAIRAIAGQADQSQCDTDAEALMAPDATIFSSVLRKIYRGQRENDALEILVCRAAELALERGLEARPVLIEIISELVASRESEFDDPARLNALGLPEDVAREERSAAR